MISTFGSALQMLTKFVKAEQVGSYCIQVFQYVGLPSTSFAVEKDRAFVRKISIGSSSYEVAPESLLTIIFNLTHYTVFAGRTVNRRMSDSFRWKFYWPHVVSDVFIVLKNNSKCFWMGSNSNRRIRLVLFPPAGSLKFVAKDNWGPLSKIRAGNQFFVIMIKRYTKLTKVLPTNKVTLTRVLNILLTVSVTAYEISDTVLSDNGQQCFSKIFISVRSYFAIIKLTEPRSHPQSNGQLKRYKKTPTTWLRLYIIGTQRSGESVEQPPTYVRNCQVHISTVEPLFSSVLSRYPSRQTNCWQPARYSYQWGSRDKHCLVATTDYETARCLMNRCQWIPHTAKRTS